MTTTNAARAASPILQRLAEANAELAALPIRSTRKGGSAAWRAAFDKRGSLQAMAVSADPVAYVRAYPGHAMAYRHLLPSDMVARIEAAETDADMRAAVAPATVEAATVAHSVGYLAIQCHRAEQTARGSFLYAGNDWRTGILLSPVFTDTVALFDWCDRNAWARQAYDPAHPCGVYRKGDSDMVPVPAQQQQACAGRFHVTFETVTPECAEIGDAAARGYVHPNGGTDELELVDDVAAYGFTLAEAVRTMGHVDDCGQWFAETGSDRCNYRTGAVTTYSLHPPRGVTPSSYRRIARALGAAR